MKKTILLAALMLGGIYGWAQNTDVLLRSYLVVKNAMVNSDGKSATSAVNAFYEVLKNDASFAQKETLLKATEKLKSAPTLDKKRAVFNEVSTTMWQLVKANTKSKQTVYYQYCPMKKAYWLSTEKEIRNPYYGESMLECGKVVETKK